MESAPCFTGTYVHPPKPYPLTSPGSGIQRNRNKLVFYSRRSNSRRHILPPRTVTQKSKLLQLSHALLYNSGRAMGVFTVALTNSAHIASIPGGFLAQFVGYQWCYYLPAILDIALFGIMLLCLPETLYVRGSKPLQTQYPILRRMGIWNLRPEDKHLSWKDFWRPFEM